VAQSWFVILKQRETAMDQSIDVATRKTPWNKGKSDRDQLSSMAHQARDAIGMDKLTVFA
jgi:hypothetical protein